MTAYLPPDPPVPEPESLIGPWRVKDCVGGGSNGVVFRAVHSKRPEAGNFAFKLAMAPDDERFLREAQLLARIHHPSVPRYEGSGFWKSSGGEHYPYLVMQWVEGVRLYEWAAQHGLTLRQAAKLLAQMARALEATHEYGVHRDVKGDNVLVSPEGRLTLVDFGCCWYPDSRPLTDSPIPPGTDVYRSPQLLRFRYLHRRDAEAYYEFQPSDDVYALGVTAYRLLTGKYPPPPTDPECADNPRRPRPPEIRAPVGLEERCPEFSALLMRMLSKEPAARGSAGEVAEALERLARYADRTVDSPWLERSLSLTAGQAKSPGLIRQHEPKVLASLVAFGVVLTALVLVVVLLVGRSADQREVAAGEPPKTASGGEKPDAGTVGMGNAALASVAPASDIPKVEQAVTRDLPERPFDGQKRPPCSSDEQPIKGGCWIPVGGKKPPCKDGWYEHEERCYAPFILLQSPPRTSEEPEKSRR
jgi:hypothetical protein